MPSTNEEAASELEAMRKDRDLTYAWIARRIDKNEMWVRRKLGGKTFMRIDDYTILKNAITAVADQATI